MARALTVAVQMDPMESIKIDADSTVRKLPEMTARMLARRYAPGAQQGGRRAATQRRSNPSDAGGCRDLVYRHMIEPPLPKEARGGI